MTKKKVSKAVLNMDVIDTRRPLFKIEVKKFKKSRLVWNNSGKRCKKSLVLITPRIYKFARL
jgi:hypothetical protein